MPDDALVDDEGVTDPEDVLYPSKLSADLLGTATKMLLKADSSVGLTPLDAASHMRIGEMCAGADKAYVIHKTREAVTLSDGEGSWVFCLLYGSKRAGAVEYRIGRASDFD